MRRFFIFDKFNTWYDWRLILTGKETPDPEPKTNYVELDGADGSLDLTEALTGEVVYGDRTVTATFSMSDGTYEAREALLRSISAALHGKRVKIVEPDDPEHYFVGRVKVTPTEKTAAYTLLTIEATCEPWRYAINETERIVPVQGSVDVVLKNDGRKTLCPSLTVAGTVRITTNGVTSELTDGSYKITDLRLRQGANVVSLSGTGSVTFTYREACL